VDKQVYAFPSERSYQCSQGHTWTATTFEREAGISIALPGQDLVPFCLFCLQEWALANLGIVTEV
jgi:hypothetical protein